MNCIYISIQYILLKCLMFTEAKPLNRLEQTNMVWNLEVPWGKFNFCKTGSTLCPFYFIIKKFYSAKKHLVKQLTNLPIRDAISNAVHPFLACVVTSAPQLIRNMATAFFLIDKKDKHIIIYEGLLEHKLLTHWFILIPFRLIVME